MESFLTAVRIFSIVAIPALITGVIITGVVKKIKVYEVFVEGAKEGFAVALRIIPFLVAMLVAVGMFRASGAMYWLGTILSPITSFIGMPAEVLPMAIVRPLSGSGALGVMTELITAHGPDSFIGRVASVMMGSGETTFYVLAVYFGSIGIRRTRHAPLAGIITDIAGIIASVIAVRFFFGM